MGTYKHYFALERRLQRAGYHIERSEAVLEVSGGRTGSLRELSAMEYSRLINRMRQVTASLDDKDKDNNRMRRKIIALFRKMGYEQEVDSTEDGLTMEADMRRIYSWVLKYGRYHKPLNSHSRSELAGLVSQVELMYASYLKEIHKN